MPTTWNVGPRSGEEERRPIEEKLVVSGFVDKPYGEDEQRCLECMYYLVHRKWCNLPELAVPVEAEWWFGCGEFQQK